MMTYPKVLACEVYCPTQWKAEVYSTYVGGYVPIAASPRFDTPTEAITWGRKWTGELE